MLSSCSSFFHNFNCRLFWHFRNHLIYHYPSILKVPEGTCERPISHCYLLLPNLTFQEAFYIYRPIVFVMDADPSFEANFVLATLAGKDSNSQVSNSQKSTQEQRQRNSAIAKRIVQKTPRPTNRQVLVTSQTKYCPYLSY